MVTVNNPTGTVMAISERAYRDCSATRSYLLAPRDSSTLRTSDGHCIITGDPPLFFLSFLPFSFFYRAHGAGYLSAITFFRARAQRAGLTERSHSENARCVAYVLHVNNTRLLRFRSLQHVPSEIRVLFPIVYRF